MSERVLTKLQKNINSNPKIIKGFKTFGEQAGMVLASLIIGFTVPVVSYAIARVIAIL